MTLTAQTNLYRVGNAQNVLALCWLASTTPDAVSEAGTTNPLGKVYMCSD